MTRPRIETTFWIETFEKRSLLVRVKRRIGASSEQSAMAAMRVAATLELGAAVLRIDRNALTGDAISLQVVKVMGRAPANYSPELRGAKPARKR